MSAAVVFILFFGAVFFLILSTEPLVGEAEVPHTPDGAAGGGDRDRVHLRQDGGAQPLQLVSLSRLALALSLVLFLCLSPIQQWSGLVFVCILYFLCFFLAA